MPVDPGSQWFRDNGVTYNDEILPAPDGWRWVSRVRYYGPRDVDRGILSPSATRRALSGIATDMAAVLAWAREKDIAIDVQRVRNLPVDGATFRVPDQIGVNPMYGFEERDNQFASKPCPMPGCDATVDSSMANCPGCHTQLSCQTCHIAFSAEALRPILHEEPIRLGCTNCVRTCRSQGCNMTIERTWRYCIDHGDHWTCIGCESTFDMTQVVPIILDNGTHLCGTCARSRCQSCGAHEDTSETVEGILCATCYELAIAGKTEPIEVMALTPEEWLMANTPERPIRLISIEQEFEAASPESGGYRHDSLCGNLLAAKLYGAGLSPYESIAGYHSSGHDMVAHVETDASVTSGGELILQKLKLDTTQDVAYMVQVQSIVKELLDDDKIRFTARCGMHIHADAHGFSVADSRNLVTLYSYLEDVLYRLGSAGFADHREVMQQGGYSLPIRKDKWGDIVKFGREFLRRADHTDSLNLMHFYAAMKKCKCGAIEFGRMEECDCIRPKCTVEWRLFNGTGDPRKMHAYIALVQAMMAWSQDRIIDADGEGFPPLEFRPKVDFSQQLTFQHYKLMDEWIERLEWMRRNLPLTQSEWESIFYCIAWSPIRHLGEEQLATIAAIERVPEPNRSITAPAAALRGVPNTRNRDRFVDGVCQDCHEPRPYCECDFDDGPDEAPW